MTGSTYVKTHAVFYPKFDQSLMDRVVIDFEIHPNKKISEMSYGERKKFLIAIGFAIQASVLLMVEPTNGLDIPSLSQLSILMVFLFLFFLSDTSKIARSHDELLR